MLDNSKKHGQGAAAYQQMEGHWASDAVRILMKAHIAPEEKSGWYLMQVRHRAWMERLLKKDTITPLGVLIRKHLWN